MNQFKEIRAKLNKLNRIQWDKKRQLKEVIKHVAFMQRRINQNSVRSPEGHPGALYVPWNAVQYLPKAYRTISSITKDMNDRKRKINQLESELQMMKDAMSMDAFFQHQDGTIIGFHAVGMKDPEGNFCQDEIWANHYVKGDDGLLSMKGGSMRVHGPFEVVILDQKQDPEWTQFEGKVKPWA